MTLAAARQGHAAKSMVGLLVALAVALGAPCAAQAHGPVNPGISAFGATELAVTLALVTCAGWRLLVARSRFLLAFAITFVGLYEGVVLFPALTHGYVLLAFGPLVGRLSAALWLGGGIGLLLSALRLADAGEPEPEAHHEDLDVAHNLG